MFFASPIWLVLLLPPWVLVAAWLMWTRRGARRDVPFLELWRGGAGDSPREKRQFRPPPIALVAALAAALLAILAAAGPGLTGAANAQGPLITIIVDRGVTMSVQDRLAEVINVARPAVLKALGEGPTDLVLVPDGTVRRVERATWPHVAANAPPTQEQTAEAVRVAVTQSQAKTDGAVVVLSDQKVPGEPRIVQISPATPLQNVGIADFVVRASPRPQAMVTVVNYSSRERATLRLRSGGRTVIERAIDLPRAAGGEATFFVDLPSPESAATAELDVDDDIALDNAAHAKRQRSFPTIEIRSTVPPEVRRVAEAYRKARSPAEGSARIAISGADQLPGDVPVAIVAAPGANPVAGPLQVAAHPVSSGVDWASAKPRAEGKPPGEHWTAVVSVGDRPAVAVREAPHRQVWIGLYAPDLARNPEFVIFWTNVFDWLGGAAGDAAQHWVSTLAAPIRIDPPPAADWRAKLASLQPARRSGTDVTSAVLLGSVICLILAAVAWPGRSLTPFSTPLTV